MGKGDKKTKRGKITMGSYGVRRPRKKTKAFKTVETKPKKETAKKTVAKPKAAAKAKTTAKKKETAKKDDKK